MLPDEVNIEFAGSMVSLAIMLPGQFAKMLYREGVYDRRRFQSPGLGRA